MFLPVLRWRQWQLCSTIRNGNLPDQNSKDGHWRALARISVFLRTASLTARQSSILIAFLRSWRWLRRTGEYGIHSLRRIKAALIDKATSNLRAIQILPGHSNIEIAPAERTEI
jgi:hypothetical protein